MNCERPVTDPNVVSQLCSALRLMPTLDVDKGEWTIGNLKGDVLLEHAQTHEAFVWLTGWMAHRYESAVEDSL